MIGDSTTKRGRCMRKIPSAAVLLALVFGFTVTGYARDHEEPPLSVLRIGGEILAGGAGGLAGGVLLPLMIERADPPPPNATEILGSSGCAIIVALAASPVCAATGVYLVGGIGNETGSFLATLAGAYLGGFVGLVVAESLPSVHVRLLWLDFGALPVSVLALGAPIGATIGFNLTRKYESSGNSDNSMGSVAAPIYLSLLRVRF